MGILVSNELKEELKKELKKTSRRVDIITAFCKIDSLKYLDEYVKTKGYKITIGTIHPDNIYSINNLIKDGFVLTGKRSFKRGPRNIYVKKLINK